MIGIAIAGGALALILTGALWLLGGREPVRRLRAEGPVHFIALRGGAAPSGALWSAAADFPFIGAARWDRFALVAGEAEALAAADAAGAGAAYVARLTLTRPPRLILGALRALALSGLSRLPPGETLADGGALGLRPELLPGADAIAALMARPADYAPAMVNFLAYRKTADYGGGATASAPVSGRSAYRRYGLVALRTVYRTGGRMLFHGRVDAVLRAPDGEPAWRDIAAMRYAAPDGILSMERAPAYRAALVHRDAGLAETVVIASTPDQA